MTKFSNKFKKPYSGPIFGPFSPFFGQKKIFSKICSFTHNTTWASNTMQSFRKN